MPPTQFASQVIADNVIRVWYTGTDVLLKGYALCYDWDNATLVNRYTHVEKPNFNNLKHFAGVVADYSPYNAASDSAGRYVDVIVPTSWGIRGVPIYCDQNVAAGDLLSIRAESYIFTFAVMHPPLAVALEAQNKSVTAGVIMCEYGRKSWDYDPTKQYRYVNDFQGDAIILGGATPAELLIAPLCVSGASVAAAYTADAGGRLVVTPNGTTIGQLNVGPLGAWTASGMSLLPFTNSAGKSIFFRTKINPGVGAIDSAWFAGLSITGAVVSNAAVPATDDYLGFFRKVDDDGSLHFATNRDNGTDNLSDTAINTVADQVYDLAFLAVNRVSGDAASACTIWVWVDGVLTNTISSAAINALMNKDEAMGLVVAGIDGAAAVAWEIDYLEACINR